jgi:hypothetical protein
MTSQAAIPRARRVLLGAALLSALLVLGTASPALAAVTPNPPGSPGNGSQGTGSASDPPPSSSTGDEDPTGPDTPGPRSNEPSESPTSVPRTPERPAATPPLAIRAPEPAEAPAPPAATSAPAPAARTPLPATPAPAATPAPPTEEPAPNAAATPVPATPAPTAPPTAQPTQRPAFPASDASSAGALDGLSGLRLPAALVLLFLLGTAGYLLTVRRKRSATVWTPPPDAEAEKSPAAPVQVVEVPFAGDPPEDGWDIPPLVPLTTIASLPAPSSAAPPPSSPPRRKPSGTAQEAGSFQVQHHVAGAVADLVDGTQQASSLHRFIAAWTGDGAELDGDPHPSMALLRSYCREVLVGPPLWGQPIDIPAQYDMDRYVWVAESPYRVPTPGDAIVWGPRPEDASDGGHVAIFVNGDANGFDAFDAAGSTPGVRHHADYRWVVGWLHPVGA